MASTEMGNTFKIQILTPGSERGRDAAGGVLQASKQHYESGHLFVAFRDADCRDARARENHTEVEPRDSLQSVKP